MHGLRENRLRQIRELSVWGLNIFSITINGLLVHTEKAVYSNLPIHVPNSRS